MCAVRSTPHWVCSHVTCCLCLGWTRCHTNRPNLQQRATERARDGVRRCVGDQAACWRDVLVLVSAARCGAEKEVQRQRAAGAGRVRQTAGCTEAPVVEAGCTVAPVVAVRWLGCSTRSTDECCDRGRGWGEVALVLLVVLEWGTKGVVWY